MAAVIAEACARHADRTALTEFVLDADAAHYRPGRTLTFSQLYLQCRQLCAALHAAGVKPGDRLVTLLDNVVESVVCEWACLLDGYVWVAINGRSSTSEVEAFLEDAQPAVIVAGPDLRHLLGPSAALRSAFVVETGPDGDWAAFLAAAPADYQMSAPDSEDPVRIRYTSATSGKAKGAVLPRRAYDASLATVSTVIGPLKTEDCVVQAAPMTHASGAMLLPHVQVGAGALLLDRFDAAAFVDLVETRRPTAVFLVPTMLVRVLAVGGKDQRLSCLRTIVYGGASMPVETLRDAIGRLGRVLVQIYGLTESTWPVTALLRDEHPLDGDAERLASCGRPTAVGQLRIVTAEGPEADVGETGEVLVRGRNTMLGYWKGGGIGGGAGCADDGGDAGDGGRGLDADGWMHTGDLAYRDAEGFVTIIDRLHDMIVSGGFNVYPREVENILASHAAVLESAVVGRADAEWGETVHAAVVVKPGCTVTAAELAAHCAAGLAGYKKPRSIELVDALPRTSSGKILRRAVRERLHTAAS